MVTTATKFRLLDRLISDEIWIEATSDRDIVWDNVPGWNFYYRIFGITRCRWAFFLYNADRLRIYARNSLIEIACDNVRLCPIVQLSPNVATYHLSSSSSSSARASASSLSSTPPGKYIYFLENPIPPDIGKLLAIFPTRSSIYDDQDCYRDNRISITNESHAPCSHPRGKRIRYVILHSTQKTVSFRVTDSNDPCFVCQIKRDLTQRHEPGYSVLLDVKTSNFVVNL